VSLVVGLFLGVLAALIRHFVLTHRKAELYATQEADRRPRREPTDDQPLP